MAATSYDVFISHAGEDKNSARAIRDAIVQAGGHVLGSREFLDEDVLRSGDYAHRVMEETARSRQLTVGIFLLSPDFIAKPWPMRELGWLLESFHARKNTATPLHLVPVFLRSTHAQVTDPAYIREQLVAKLTAGRPEHVSSALDDAGELSRGASAVHSDLLEQTNECLRNLRQLVQHTGKRRDHVRMDSPGAFERAVAQDVVDRLQERLGILPLPSEAQSLDELVAPLVQHVCKIADASLPTADASILDAETGLSGALPAAPTMLLVHGMGGSGKTTQASRMFNDASIRSRYNKMCFVAVKREPDLLSLQALLLRKLCGYEEPLTSEQHGLATLRRHLAGVRALVVLDDVWKEGVLQQLVVDMVPGSVIVVTSRFQLKATLAMPVAMLEPDAALALFCTMAKLGLDGAKNTEEAVEVVGRCGKLPLALKTLGSLVRKCVDERICDSVAGACKYVLQQLAQRGTVVDDDGMLASLRVSYNALKDFGSRSLGAQQMFVNIGIFSKENTERAIVAWHHEVLGRNLERARQQLGLLRDLHLIEVSPGGVVSLHDQLAALAKHICTTFLQSDTGPVDRMFLHGQQDAETLDDLGLSVRCRGRFQQLLQLAWDDLPEVEEQKRMAAEIIQQAPELQILRLDESVARTLDLRCHGASGSQPSRGDGCLLGRLKLLSLQSCPYLTSIRADGVKLANIRVLDFSGCCLLTSLAGLNIGQCKSLHTLNLTGCISIQLPEDLGEAHSLKRLLLNSSYITALPPSTTKLVQLQELRLGCCPELHELPAGLLQACTQLEILELRASGLSELPCDIQHLQRLKYLIFTDMHKVQRLPMELGLLSSLEALYLGMNTGLVSLPASITKLTSLRHLDNFHTPNIKLNDEQQAFVDAFDHSDGSEFGWLWVERAASTTPMVKALLTYKDIDKQLVSKMLQVLYLMVNNEDNRSAVIRSGGLLPLLEMWLHPFSAHDEPYTWCTLSNMGVTHARQIFRAAVDFCLGRPAAKDQCCRMKTLMKVYDMLRARSYDSRFYGDGCHKIWPELLQQMDAQVSADNSPAAYGLAICGECRLALKPRG